MDLRTPGRQRVTRERHVVLQQISPLTRAKGRVNTARSLPSPLAQTRRSPPVGTSLRCLPSSVPSGPMYSSVLNRLAPLASLFLSLTPIATATPARRAAAHRRSVDWLGIAIELACRTLYAS